MNEDQTYILLKKSALKTTEDFTDTLIEKIEATSTAQVKSSFPSIKGVFLTIAIVMLLLSFLLFYTNFTFLSEIEIMGNFYRTKLFIVVLFLVLLGINHLLKVQHRSKYLLNN